MFDLTGKTALVTGATGAIGGAAAAALKGQGARLIVVGSTQERADDAAQRLGADAAIGTDLSDRAAVDTLASEAEKAGPVDILVNNAGITRDQLLMRMKDADFDAVIEINLTAAFRLSRGLIRGMLKRRWGRIITIGSGVGSIGNMGQVNYAAAKAGLTGLTKSMAREVANRNITANMVAPGLIESKMSDAMSDEARALMLQHIPMQQLGKPEDIAGAIVYLASQEARYVTGQTIHVNGGMFMGF
ncbi:3-oxoacyl-ACP reductase FabG [Acuticoccus sp. I52.16.1]|uniref:3-oxoacyl-ACP reductase FabG n=1 Tax=Acuticoccus sp. I52.16.1 TaxID=2928472 RepID=UPI001FD3CE7B|nr:3-oxoacyl-ACP reductase FabG [Acuticoccus sp. I52.16.1]UOM33880.1 3-oxoacyl-ACP reductase FabG [Acuticoccus sp. I52.16.1]